MLNEKIRFLCLQKGWEPIDLAYHMGVSPSTVYRLLSQKGKPSNGSVKLVADSFGITVEELKNSPSLNLQNISRNIEFFLAEKGWTISYLGELTGIYSNTILSIISGNRVPRNSTLLLIAKSFNVTINELICSPGDVDYKTA